jgi:hypothetical protein
MKMNLLSYIHFFHVIFYFRFELGEWVEFILVRSSSQIFSSDFMDGLLYIAESCIPDDLNIVQAKAVLSCFLKSIAKHGNRSDLLLLAT